MEITGNNLKLIIKDGIITEVSSGNPSSNLYISPRFIDLHCHLREPGGEGKETLETGIKSAFVTSYNYLYNETKSMLIVLKQLFTGKIPLKNMHGVVLITKMGGDIISSEGIFYGILLTAVISMNLAILNILPIPALDGGHLLFLLIEKIQGKPVDEEVLNKIMTVFFSLLILLLIFVLFNDIYVLIQPLFVK